MSQQPDPRLEQIRAKLNDARYRDALPIGAYSDVAYLLALIDTLQRERDEWQWRPIETYDKQTAPEVLLGWFDPDIPESPGMQRVGFWHSRERAFCDTHQVLHNQQSHPTHWKLLQQRPALSAPPVDQQS